MCWALCPCSLLSPTSSPCPLSPQAKDELSDDEDVPMEDI